MKRRETRQRVVVTGLGALTPLGRTVDEFWQGLVRGRSGVGTISFFDASSYPCSIAGEVKGFEPERYMEPKAARRMGRFSQFAVAATREALEHARLDLSREARDRCGVLLGNGNGGYPETEAGVRTLMAKGGMRLSPFFLPMTLPNIAASQVSLTFGLQGYNNTVVTACAAGTQAIGEAAEVIRRGAADVLVTGGVEAGITELGLAGFCAMKALSTTWNHDPPKASRPFDLNRNGFVPAEGAGILVLERLDHALERGAPVLAEVLGYGTASDAFHVVQPDENGAGAARAMTAALTDAGLAPSEVDYVNAHGTSTPLNDVIETLAIQHVFGEGSHRLAISATKSMTGHAMGGAGGMESVACIKTLVEGVIHPTINLESPDPQCGLDYVPNVARQAQVNIAQKNSFGFGGQNACVIFGRFAP